MSAVCAGCGRSWPATARFCAACGAPTAGRSRRGTHPSLWVTAALVAVAVVTFGGGRLLTGAADQDGVPTVEEPTVRTPEVRRPAPAEGPVADDAPQADAVGEATARCATSLDAAPDCRVVTLSEGAGATVVSVLDDGAVVIAEEGAITRRELPGALPSWRASPFPEPLPATSLSDGGLLVVATRTSVVRLDPTSGAVMWRIRPVHAMASAPQLRSSHDGLLLLDASGRLTLHDVDDGSVRWSVPDVGPEALPELPDGPRPRSDRVLPTEPHGDDGIIMLTGAIPDGLAGVGLQWAPVGHEALVTAVDGDGQLLWSAGPLPLLCCSPAAVPGRTDRLVVAADSRSGAVLDAVTGEVLAALQAPRGTLVGAVDGVGLWDLGEELVGLRWSDATEVFTATGELVTVAPLIIDGPSGPVHVALGDGLPSPMLPRPFR